MAVRTLFHVHGGTEHGAQKAGNNHLHEPLMTHGSTLDLRIAAVFVILGSAVLLGLPTLLLKQFQTPDAAIPRLSRAFSGGVLLALALVHVIPEAITDLNSLVDFPLGGCTVLLGILLLLGIDSAVTALLTSAAQQQRSNQSRQWAPIKTAAVTSPGISHASHHCLHYNNPLAANTEDDAHDELECTGMATCKKSAELMVLDVSTHDPDSPMIAAHHTGSDSMITSSSRDCMMCSDSAEPTNLQIHSNHCFHSLPSASWQPTSAQDIDFKQARRCVTAYTMELGCIFHSIIIGVGLGVLTENRSLVLTLLIALAVHQSLEGLALGSVVALTNLPMCQKLTMMVLYSITTPIGICIGIAVAGIYDPESVTSRAVQGTLNGVSGGMLLYIGMLQLAGEELSRQGQLSKPHLRAGICAAVCLGAALMCVLAIWS